MKAPTGSNRIVIVVAAMIVVLLLLSGAGLYVLEQNKNSLPPVVQAMLGGRLVHIHGHAMSPALRDGDIVTFDTRAYLDHPPHRGDIILFVAPDNAERLYVDRVIAVPDDRLRISNGVVYVNGQVIAEPYVGEPWVLAKSWPATGMEQMLPRDQYFVMGDDRNYSHDSREFGFVYRSQILGKLMR